MFYWRLYTASERVMTSLFSDTSCTRMKLAPCCTAITLVAAVPHILRCPCNGCNSLCVCVCVCACVCVCVYLEIYVEKEREREREREKEERTRERERER